MWSECVLTVVSFWHQVYANVGTKLDKSSIVQIWRSPHIARTPAFNRYISPAEVVADGYQTLVDIGYSATSWYLDNLKNDWCFGPVIAP